MSNPNFLTANTAGIELMPGVNDTAVGYDVNRVIQALNGINLIPITTGNLTVSGTITLAGGSAPATPTGLVAIGALGGVILYWNEITPGTISPKQYQIAASLDPNFTTVLVNAPENSTIVVSKPATANPNPWLVTVGPQNNLFFSYPNPNTTIYFKIRAIDWAGNISAYSSVVSATTVSLGQSLTAFTGKSLGTLTVNSDGTVPNFNAIDFTNTAQVPPIARIATKFTGGGSELHFGTSNNYALGITNDAMKIDPSGNVTVTKDFDSATLNGGLLVLPTPTVQQTLGTVPQMVSIAPVALSGISSASFLMAGFGANNGWVLTPQVTGRVLILFSSDVYNGTANAGGDFSLAYGTGTAPAQFANPIGTVIAGSQGFFRNQGNSNTQNNQCVFGVATGLTLGTQYWFDVQIRAFNGGSVGFFNTVGLILEI